MLFCPGRHRLEEPEPDELLQLPRSPGESEFFAAACCGEPPCEHRGARGAGELGGDEAGGILRPDAGKGVAGGPAASLSPMMPEPTRPSIETPCRALPPRVCAASRDLHQQHP